MNFEIKIALSLLMAFMVSSGLALQLKDVELKSGTSETAVRVFFIGTPEEGEYPMYFQKFDSSKQTLTLSFLETETNFPLGRHAIEPGSPGMEELQLRKMTSPSGKTFLGLELKLLAPLQGDALVQSIPKQGLKIIIGAGSQKKFNWSLSKSIKAREDYLAAKAEPPSTAKLENEPKASVAVGTKLVADSVKTISDDFPASLTSAHQSGSKLDAAQGKASLSLSKVFSIGNSGKPMIMIKDSSEMKDQMGSQGKLVKKIPLGSKVEKLDGKEGWLKIVDGIDTGFVRAKAAVYVDEMTESQEKTLKSMLESKQAKLAALDAQRVEREAKLAAKAEEARKKAEEAIAAAAAKAVPEAVASTQPQQPVSEVVGQPAEAPIIAKKGQNTMAENAPKLSIADSPELAEKLAREKKTAEEEKLRVEPEEKRVTYNSYGRRDPFIPVDQSAADNGIDIDQMKVVGIIWQSSEPMAVLEHTHEANVSYTVKQGDPIHNGRVGKITREAVTFDISEYGISRSYSLKLVSSKEGTKK
jgi:hypothetical protein